MSTSSARSFRTEGAFKRAAITRGYLSLAFMPLPSPEPIVASVVGPIPLALPQYPNVLARTYEGALVFMRPVPVIHRRGLSLLG